MACATTTTCKAGKAGTNLVLLRKQREAHPALLQLSHVSIGLQIFAAAASADQKLLPNVADQYWKLPEEVKKAANAKAMVHKQFPVAISQASLEASKIKAADESPWSTAEKCASGSLCSGVTDNAAQGKSMIEKPFTSSIGARPPPSKLSGHKKKASFPAVLVFFLNSLHEYCAKVKPSAQYSHLAQYRIWVHNACSVVETDL